MIGQTKLCQALFLARRNYNHPTRLTQGSRNLRTWTGVATLAALTLLLLLSATVAVGQSAASGTIVGTITDPSGAVVPGADVAITDRTTNSTSKTTSNKDGHFAFVNVTPSTYDIKITKSGFETALVRNQTVQIGQALTEDVSLPLGSVTQEVTVETTGTELQTLNATVGNTVSGVALESLPSIGGDVSTFMTLQPGVAPGGQVGGTVSDQSTFQLDGGNNTSDMDGNQTVYTPSFGSDPTGGVVGSGLRGGQTGGGVPTGVMPTPADSVEEFKVNTSNQTADFNSSAGAQIQIVTKRGTNAWHGTAYEYYLDNNFNANTWSNNLTGTPNPSYHYSRFGGAVGGPLISKEILGGKTYFFANYQGFRWPNSTTYEMAVPSMNMRNGILTMPNGSLFNLNTNDPRKASDVGNGINPFIQQFWNKYEPPPNDPNCTGSPISGSLLGTYCDGVNVQGYKANMAIPQKDNFGVVRIDHDFGAKWHFNSSYRYYHLTRATTDQVDLGGFFTGDTLGQMTSLSNRPEVPWYLVAGLTTNITNNTTNDFHYSFLRNFWSWGTQNAPVQVAGLGGALEPLGEQHYSVLAPYNVNAQQIRTRFWDGKDHYLRDDITMLHGNHLFTFGGAYQHNFNYHQRTDNGGGINFTPTYQLGDTSGSANQIFSSLYPAGVAESQQYDRYMASMLGIVSDSQVAYTRTGANLALNPPLTPAYDQSTIPYYNVYFSDSWHIKPSLTITYGMGYTLEMPPTEANGKQVILVDSANQPIQIDNYLAGRERAALQGQVYNPQVGFSLIGNTANSPKYPYDPFYGAFSPRVAVAWNPHFGEGWTGKIFGGDKTVIRAGYGRIYGRLNGVNLVLVPLLGTGLIQAVQCTKVLAAGTCGPATPTPATAFRVGPTSMGLDGLVAPLNAATPTLPQPVYPGTNLATPAGAGTALDPHTRPNAVDSVDFTIQRQLTNKITMEVGYIGRYIRNEFQSYNINAVPYMMTLGGQSFSSAYAGVETALGCATSVSACGASVPAVTLANGSANPAYAAYINAIPQQAFLTSSLNTAFCTGNYKGTGGAAIPNCTAAFVNSQLTNLTQQKVWTIWNTLDQGGSKAGFNFGCSLLTCTPAGASSAQLSNAFVLNSSDGYGNYNAGFLTFRMSDYHGVTLQQNLTYGKALGTGDVTQSTSSYTVEDPFNLNQMYGTQTWDRKYVYNAFVVYQPPYYKGQQGVMGHLLGGWNFSPIFTAGSGQPLLCSTRSTPQSFGSGDGTGVTGDNEECLITGGYNGSTSANYNVPGGVDSNGVSVGTTVANCTNANCKAINPAGVPVGINMFANPVAVFDQAVNPILGINTRDAGSGPIRGLPYWNVDMDVRKNFKLTERFSTEFQFLFLNVFNHMLFNNPTLSTTSPKSWGVLNSQVNIPRQMEFGLRVSF
jgi:hypothetical protein